MLPLLMVVVVRKILVGVVDSIPPPGGGESSNLSQESNMGGLHALLDKSGKYNRILS